MTSLFIDRITNFLNTIRYDPTRLTILDPSTSHYNFRLYLECCESLNITPSITKYVTYNSQWKKYFNK
jgi:hypothetical protein